MIETCDLVLQCFTKRGNRHPIAPASLRPDEVSKIHKVQLLRFIKKTSSAAAIVGVEVKSCQLLDATRSHVGLRLSEPQNNNSSSSSAKSEKMESQIFCALMTEGDFFEVELVPTYVPDGGQKTPSASIIITINSQEVYRWDSIVYHPRYGSRLPQSPPTELKCTCQKDEWYHELREYRAHKTGVRTHPLRTVQAVTVVPASSMMDYNAPVTVTEVATESTMDFQSLVLKQSPFTTMYEEPEVPLICPDRKPSKQRMAGTNAFVFDCKQLNSTNTVVPVPSCMSCVDWGIASPPPCSLNGSQNMTLVKDEPNWMDEISSLFTLDNSNDYFWQNFKSEVGLD